MSNQEQMLEWHIFDQDEMDDHAWHSMHAPAQDNAPRGRAMRRGRDLLMVVLFLTVLLWMRPWSNGDAIDRADPAATLRPVTSAHGEAIPPTARHAESVASEPIFDRQALANYQARLPKRAVPQPTQSPETMTTRRNPAGSQALRTPGHMEAIGGKCLCGCVTVQPTGGMSHRASPRGGLQYSVKIAAD